MHAHEPFKTWFWQGIEIQQFNQMKTFLQQITPQKKAFFIFN